MMLPGKAWHWTMGVLGLLFVVVVYAIVTAEPTNAPVSASNPPPPPAAESGKPSIGDDAVLRFGTSDTVFLASDETSFDTLVKTLMANDTYGMIELAAAGKAFGVGQGTKVKVIDSGVGRRKVRILSSDRSVDKDKTGLSGWAFMEAVVRE